MKIVKTTLLISLYIQVITTILGLFGLIIKLKAKDNILKEILTLETVVQIVEFLFYFWFSYFYNKNVDKQDIAKYRYYDWVITTPIMLISTIMYFEYNNNDIDNKYNTLNLENQDKQDKPDKQDKQDKPDKQDNLDKPDKIYGLNNFISDNNYDNVYNIIYIAIFNFLMLLMGYLSEIKVMDTLVAVIIGFVFFIIVFYRIYARYVKDDYENKYIFYFLTFVWALYGVAALFPNNVKNASYNILDIISKNFYGLYIAYIIYTKRIN